MKIAHTVENGLGGMSAVARLEVYWERKLGHDARLVFRKDEGLGNREDVPIADFEFVKHCDVIVLHSLLDQNVLELGIPVVLVIHGTPEYCFSVTRMTPARPYSQVREIMASANCAGGISYWKRHIPYWEQLVLPNSLRFVHPSVDLEAFTPGPPEMSVFGGTEGEINIVSTGRWRLSHDPFHAVHAFGVFQKRFPQAQLHIVGASNFVALGQLIQAYTYRRCMGMVTPHTARLVDLYRSADVCITGHNDAGLTVREALACGCQVVGDTALEGTPYTADQYDLEAYADQIEQAYTERQTLGRDAISARNRKSAEEHFDPERTAEETLAVLGEIVNKAENVYVVRPAHSDDSKEIADSISNPSREQMDQAIGCTGVPA